MSQRARLAGLSRLLPFVRPYRGRVLLAAVALLLAAGATLSVPLAFRHLIDAGFGSQQAVDGPFLALFGVAVLLALATALRFYSVSWLGERVTADLRSAVFSQVLAQDPAFFDDIRSGEVLSRLTTDTALVQTLVGTSVSLGLRNAVLGAGALVMMLITEALLALMMIGLLAATLIPVIAIGRRVRRLSRASQDRIADASALAGETLGAIQIVQAFNRGPWEAARFAAAAELAFEAAARRVRVRAALTAIAIVLSFGVIVFVLRSGAGSVLAGEMSAGLLAQFVLYAALLAGAIGAIAEVIGDIQRAAGAAERLSQLLDATPAIGAQADRATLSQPDTGSAPHVTASTPPAAHRAAREPAIMFDSVTFAYPTREQPALEAVSFAVAPGETVALVGPSGSGKSTVFQLLLRFRDPQAGAVRMDGIDLRALEPAMLRARIGLVSQDSTVFSADVLENIRYGRLEATDEEVMEAARAAHALEFIDRLPQRWQTPLGERGVRLSGGQRQRIAIARALLRDPELLLLDEATSSLDAQSEREVQAALEEATSGRTTVVIAHRLATVRRADRILVLERGRLVETGTHASLSATGGLYSRLAAMQFDAAREFALR
ncbi:MAG: ATP-binding cassette domain-containing protein [Betaproteobacteria bacterium]|nr:ATP-binding cassette domain-containing protein [Betaproteobacteria bacterium]